MGATENKSSETKPSTDTEGHVPDDLLSQILREGGVEITDLDGSRDSIKPSTWHL